MSIERSSRSGKKEKEATDKSRREFLQIAGAGTVALAGGGLLLKSLFEGGAERSPVIECDFAEVGLAGESCTGIASQYFDLPDGARFPKSGKVNFQASLKEMWDRKIRWAMKHAKPPHEEETVRDIKRLAARKLAEYEALWNRNEEKRDIDGFRDLVDALGEIERDVLASDTLDWEGVGKYYAIEDPLSIDALKNLSSRATGRALTAYSMTEIMPGGKGKELYGARVYDTLLRYGGIAAANITPAMYDARPSYGLFQLTDLAVDKGSTRPRHVHGFNKEKSLNDFLPERLRLPESIRDFTTLEHHATGALLLGLDGVASAVRALEEMDADGIAIQRVLQMDPKNFASVLAAHHYRPKVAHKALIAWAEDANWGSGGQAEQEPYHVVCTAHDANVGKYARISFGNYEEIDAYFDRLNA